MSTTSSLAIEIDNKMVTGDNNGIFFGDLPSDFARNSSD
jgi:hypothetical protein